MLIGVAGAEAGKEAGEAAGGVRGVGVQRTLGAGGGTAAGCIGIAAPGHGITGGLATAALGRGFFDGL